MFNTKILTKGSARITIQVRLGKGTVKQAEDKARKIAEPKGYQFLGSTSWDAKHATFTLYTTDGTNPRAAGWGPVDADGEPVY